MGIYDWIKSMDVSVLDDFKSNPGSITFVVSEEFADNGKTKTLIKLERFECGQNTRS